MVELYGVYESLAVRGHYLPCSALRLTEGHIKMEDSERCPPFIRDYRALA